MNNPRGNGNFPFNYNVTGYPNMFFYDHSNVNVYVINSWGQGDTRRIQVDVSRTRGTDTPVTIPESPSSSRGSSPHPGQGGAGTLVNWSGANNRVAPDQDQNRNGIVAINPPSPQPDASQTPFYAHPTNSERIFGSGFAPVSSGGFPENVGAGGGTAMLPPLGPMAHQKKHQFADGILSPPLFRKPENPVQPLFNNIILTNGEDQVDQL